MNPEPFLIAVAGTLVSALLIWISGQVWRIGARLAVVEAKLGILQNEIEKLERMTK